MAPETSKEKPKRIRREEDFEFVVFNDPDINRRFEDAKIYSVLDPCTIMTENEIKQLKPVSANNSLQALHEV
jgi:hypothetical protein